MKKVFAILALILGFYTADAQTKVAHVNLQDLFEAMPERDSLNTALTEYQNGLAVKFQLMANDYQTLEAELGELGAKPNKTAMENAQFEYKKQQYVELQTKLQQENQSIQEKISAKEKELFEPLKTKMLDAVKAVATEKGYDYVVNSSEGTPLLYMNDSHDILADVKTKLGIQ